MRVTEDTKATAQAVVDYILANPEKHEQACWLGVKEQFSDDDYDVIDVDSSEAKTVNLCNTTMCVAGTAVYVSRNEREFRNFLKSGGGWEDEASELLGLEEDEANALFYNMSNATALAAVQAVAAGDPDKFEEVLYVEDE
jgi:hypothetical protein